MEKTKVLSFAVIGLVVLNLGILVFLFLNGKNHKPPHDRRPEPKQIIIDKLHFDAKQQQDYAKLITGHRAAITRLDDSIRKAKNELYLLLNEDTVDEKVKVALLDEIAVHQKQIEQTHFKHFQDIKKLCRKDQLDDFEALTEDLSRIFAPKPPRKRHD